MRPVQFKQIQESRKRQSENKSIGWGLGGERWNTSGRVEQGPQKIYIKAMRTLAKINFFKTLEKNQTCQSPRSTFSREMAQSQYEQWALWHVNLPYSHSPQTSKVAFKTSSLATIIPVKLTTWQPREDKTGLELLQSATIWPDSSLKSSILGACLNLTSELDLYKQPILGASVKKNNQGQFKITATWGGDNKWG